MKKLLLLISCLLLGLSLNASKGPSKGLVEEKDVLVEALKAAFKKMQKFHNSGELSKEQLLFKSFMAVAEEIHNRIPRELTAEQQELITQRDLIIASGGIPELRMDEVGRCYYYRIEKNSGPQTGKTGFAKQLRELIAIELEEK